MTVAAASGHHSCAADHRFRSRLMAINFPNDPATNPGDGGTWVDGDGNTWTVEIVSGEAIWTMTAAADTGGGGGGDVTSVAGKTGAVDLELNDLTDVTVSSASNTKLVKVENSGGDTTAVFNPNGLSVYEYAGIRVRTDGAVQIVGGSGSAAGERSCILSKDGEVQFTDAPTDTESTDRYTVKIEVTQTDGDAAVYRAAPTLGTDATDLVIPTMGQVRAAIASNGGTSVSLNDLSDVNYTQKDSDDSWTLEPINLDEILFQGQDTPSDVTRKVFTNSAYGMALASYDTAADEGSYIYAHETKGIILRSPSDNGVLWIEGKSETTTSQPEIRITNGNGTASTPTGNYIGFKMPAGVAADVTWTLPGTDGLSGYVLATDGSGNLSFTAPPNPSVGVISYDIGYESTTAYKFTGPGLDGTELNPTLYVVRGQTYIFNNYLGAHPFQLQTVAGTGQAPYTDGVIGTSDPAQPVSLGTINWEVQMDAPSTIFYQCTAHTAMAGTIKILDGSGSAAAATAYSFNDQTSPEAPTEAGQWHLQQPGLANNLCFCMVDADGKDTTEIKDLPVGSKIILNGTEFTTDDVGGLFSPTGTGAWFLPILEDLTPLAGSETLTVDFPAAASGVDSVNSQTGVVSLGIQDMNDYALQLSDGSTQVLNYKTDNLQENSPAGYYEIATNYIGYLDADASVLSGLVSGTNVTFEAGGLTLVTTVSSDPAYLGPGRQFFYISDSWPAEWLALPTGTPLTISSVVISPNPVPLASGDILQWDVDAFKPTALATVASTGDYNDLINAPSVGDAPVTSVNTETGDVSLGIQDMDDYALKTESGVFVWDGVTETSSTNDGEFGADRYSGYDNSNWQWYNFYVGVEDKNGSTAVTDWIGSNLTNADSSSTATFILKVPGLSIDTEVTAYTGATYSGNYLMRLPRNVGVNPDQADWLGLGTSFVSFDGYEVEFYPKTLGSIIELADNDILQWNSARSKFEPTQLDYSQINNTPAPLARTTVDITTASLALGATEVGEITGTGASGLLISAQTDVAAWIRLYTSSATSTQDAGRDKDTDPIPGSGVLFEALYTTFTEKPITPGTTYFNLEGDSKLYYRITNESAIDGTPITVTFKILPLE